ncbi:hypothetical protein LNV09_11475 [Paucibacter sp. B2R-40]|uniref:hypothetical protein n=1 Tax=Paucibacter sp. B2R-40 TaxID=2893554 RepID=UPI0021E4ACE3|nr:hypothetical protein [Paucibacter sp. B2R-40]MCV2354777.1 hypothetical protein [Paucibacter sp. B2R-40]
MGEEAGDKRVNPKTLLWVERLVWIFIYAGLLVFVLGLALLQFGPHSLGGKGEGMTDAEVLAYLLLGKGALAVAAGVLMIWLRSRWK